MEFDENILLTTEIWSKNEIQDGGAAILNFNKSVNFGQSVWGISICKPNLVQIGLEIAEIHLFLYFQDDGHPPSWIGFTPILDFPRRSPSLAKFSLLMAL